MRYRIKKKNGVYLLFDLVNGCFTNHRFTSARLAKIYSHALNYNQ